MRTPATEYQTGNAATQAQQYTLNEKLTHNAPAARPQSYTNRSLARTMDCARQHQICNVRTRDQQHKRHGSHQRFQNELFAGTDFKIKIGLNGRLDAFFCLGMIRRDAGRNSTQLGLSLYQRDHVAQTPDHPELEGALVLFKVVDDWNPNLICFREFHAFRHDPHNLVIPAAQFYRLTDGGGVAGVSRLP
jgi:hypothetical protein